MTANQWIGPTDGDSLARAIDQPVSLVDHDPRWVGVYAAERERLKAIFPDTFVDIVHIGSTPVPGLRAKPVIDLLAGVRSMDEAIALGDALCANGYNASPEINRAIADRQFFMRHADGRRTHHLHVVVHDSNSWREHVDFAVMLRDDPSIRHRYEQLKLDLVARYAHDRDAYTEGKSDFINAAVRGATPAGSS